MGSLTIFVDFMLFCALPLGAIYGLLRMYQHRLSVPRPGDIPQIKADLEANEHRVVDIQPAGFERGSLVVRDGNFASYRKYRVVVRSPLGGQDKVMVVGVQAGLFAFSRLKFYARPNDFALNARSNVC